jgi:CheY-like chemotaxis protein
VLLQHTSFNITPPQIHLVYNRDLLQAAYVEKLAPIVIIDDDDNERLLAARHVRKSGRKNPVLEFKDPRDAISYFSARQNEEAPPASVVFCDIDMPGLDGFAVIRQLRQLSNCVALPIVLLSNSKERLDQVNGYDVGGSWYIVKFPEQKVFTDLLHAVCR